MQWDDHRAIRQAAKGDAALCTVVSIEGSWSRRRGAQLAITSDGDCVGSLADGCLENQLVSEVEQARAEGRPLLVRFGEGAKSIDYRLPCGSSVEILVDPEPDVAACSKAIEALERREAASLKLPCEAGPERLSAREFIPVPRLVLLGEGPEPAALATLAMAFGCSVEWHAPFGGRMAEAAIADLSLGLAPQDIAVDDWTAVLALFHDHEWERALLAWALESPAFHVGAQGGRRTVEERKQQLAGMGVSKEAMTRLHSPIGLIPSTRDPQVLALSILSEVIAEYEKLHPHG